MKKIFILLFSFCSLSYSAGIYDGVDFSDSEEQTALYLCNYSPYQSFIDLGFNSNSASSLVSARPYASFLDCSNNSSMTSQTTRRVWEYTHFVDLRLLTTSIGLSYRDYYFLMGLSGLLVGFTFLFFILYTAVGIARRRF